MPLLPRPLLPEFVGGKTKLHVLMQGLKTAIIEGHEIGGTCVNRGCVPSKALLAASGRVRDMKNEMHLRSLGIQVYKTPEHQNVFRSIKRSCS